LLKDPGDKTDPSAEFVKKNALCKLSGRRETPISPGFVQRGNVRPAESPEDTRSTDTMPRKALGTVRNAGKMAGKAALYRRGAQETKF